MKRYHPFLVALHWMLAALVVGGLIMGGQVLAKLPNDTPDKLFSLRMHMSVGMAIGVLMLVRLVTRLRTQHPAPADTGNTLLNLGGRVAHWALYALVPAALAFRCWPDCRILSLAALARLCPLISAPIPHAWSTASCQNCLP